jgi:hypothetical protein
MPVVNKNQIEGWFYFAGQVFHANFKELLKNMKITRRHCVCGIAYAVDQIVDLMSNNVDGYIFTL